MNRQQFLLRTALALVGASFVTVTSAAETIRIACVGDSITYGSGVAGRETNAYPAVLGRLLGDKYEVKNFGVGGATLLKNGDKPYWKLPQFSQVGEFAPKVIVLKLGTNDSKPQNWAHKDEFAADYRAMLEHFAALPSKPRIYLCLPAPVYETKWGINEPVVKDEVIPTIQRLAKEKGLTVIDLHAALADKPNLFPDKIHPNADGARLMAETIHAVITKP